MRIIDIGYTTNSIFQDEHDDMDGPLDAETDDSLDELLQYWDHRPDQNSVPSWKAVLKNTEMCNRCGKKVRFNQNYLIQSYVVRM